MTSDETIGAYLEQRTGDGAVPAGARRTRDLLGTASTWADPPPEVLDRALAAIRAERADPPAAPAAGPPATALAVNARVVAAAPVNARGSAVPPAAAAPARRLPRRRLFTLAAGIVAFGAGTLAGWVATGLPDREPGTEVQLAGTELAPEATANGTVRDTPDGVAITLRIDLLAPAGPGEYYAAWVTGPDLEPVPIGSFHLRDGGEPIELWAGVDTTQYHTITVTIESEQDGPQSSGEVVLRGTIPRG
jgi:hypothetical protein